MYSEFGVESFYKIGGKLVGQSKSNRVNCCLQMLLLSWRRLSIAGA